MKPVARLYLLALLLAPALCFAQSPSAAQDAVWAREVTYWKSVQAADLVAYRALWRDDNDILHGGDARSGPCYSLGLLPLSPGTYRPA